MKTWTLAIFAATLSFCAPLHSEVLYQTGFEPPTFVPGAIAGQDSWGPSTSKGTIQGAVVSTGTQALTLDGSPVSSPARLTVYDPAGKAATIVRLSTAFRFDTAADTVLWEVIGAHGLLAQLCDVYARGSSQRFELAYPGGSSGSMAAVAAVWHQVQLDIDFGRKSCTAFVDGAFLGTGSIGTASDHAFVLVGVAVAGTGKAYWDDLSIVTVDPSTQVVEFYNSILDNYFITSNTAEVAAIDGGSAGPGWSRTGMSFTKGGTTPVCRFYGSLSPGPNSHFYTADPDECASLKALQASTPASQKRWNFESNDFLTTPAVGGKCAAALTPVYRAYNNGFSRGVDSNHRITTSKAAIQQVVARGWVDEGIVMCAPGP